MPGVVAVPSAASTGAVAGMKRAHGFYGGDVAAPHDGGHPPAKRRKVVHACQFGQPLQFITDYNSAELDPTEQHRRFFDAQLQRAIAVECKAVGFDGARPEALEGFRGLVVDFMHNFLADVRTSMNGSRRASTVPQDWIYALSKNGIKGSGPLEQHLDTGNIPKRALQPVFPPPETDAPPEKQLTTMLPELSGRADKEARKYIPSHFPELPPKHTWMTTAVVTKREIDPRKIREKATEEGILAEQSLRRLMAAQKAGLHKGDNAHKVRKSKRIRQSDALWQEAMKSIMHEEEQRADEARRQAQIESDLMDAEYEGGADPTQHQAMKAKERGEEKLTESVHVTSEQKYWRKAARGF